MAQSSNFYKILTSRFSPQEHKLLFCISLIYALACTTQISFPILFKEPHLFCGNQTNLSSEGHFCYESEVCNNQEPFYIDKKNGPRSLSTQFELICERKSEQRKSLSIIFGVSMFGVLFNLFTILKPCWRKSFYSFCGIVIGASQLFSVYFSNNLMLISFFLGLASLGYILILTYSFLLINDSFEDETVKVSFGVLNILWGALGVTYSLLGMWTNADWKALNIITGVPIIVASVILNMLDEDQEADFIVPQSPELPRLERESNWKLMKEAFETRSIKVNFLVFLFYWFVQVLTYIGLPIELESVGGNLYINLAVFALIELVGSYIASELSLKFDFLVVFKWFINITILLFMFFFLIPSNLKSQNSYIITFFVADSFAVKLTYDTTWHLIGMYLPNLFTPRYYGQYLIVAVSISRFCLIFLPYINYLARGLGFHPFAIYGILWLLSRLLLRYAEIIHKNKKAQISGNSLFEMRSGVISDDHKIKDVDSANRLVIKRENKLKRYVELKETLIPVEETEDHKPEYIDNIDQAIGEGRRTLVFEGLKLPEVPKADLFSHSGSNEDNKNLPTIVRKNVKSLKRRMSKIEVSEIIKSENPIIDVKKQLYGEESPILKEIRKDAIHEENEGKD